MNIRTGTFIKSSAASAFAKLDKQLADGVVPKNVHIVDGRQQSTAQIFDRPQRDSVELTDGSEKVQESANLAGQRRIQFGVGAAALAIPGALLGAVGVPGNPLLGAALGAGVGMVMHWDSNRGRNHGRVAVENDGESYQRTWVGSPEQFVKTPAELRTILHSTGVLGDFVIPQSDLKLAGFSNAELFKDLDEQKDNLKTLAKQRRLLGNFGGKTRYGKDALQVITATTARELLSRGQGVTLLTLKEVQDTEHSFSSQAYSGNYSKQSLQKYQYTERKLSYELELLKSPDDLEGVGEGRGLPDTASGVPINSQEFVQTMTKIEAQGSREIRNKEDKTQTEFSKAMLGSRKESASSNPLARSLNSMVNPSTLGYTAVGAVLGATVGAGVPGLDSAAAATIGGVVGHLAGRLAVSKAASPEDGNAWGPSQAHSVGHWATIGAGVVVGAGLGVLGSQAPGNAGEVSSLAVGSFGGGAAGLLAGNPWGSVDRAMVTGGLGFIAGSGLGIAKMLGVDGLASTIAIGALGGVLGGATAALATRPKNR